MLPYILTFTEGILTFISPCILPMLPVYFLYLAGTSGSSGSTSVASGGSGGEYGPAKSRLIVNALGFSAGFTLVFVSLGAAAAAVLGTLLQSNRALLQMISGTVMILFGLNFTGVLKIPFLNSEKRFRPKADNMRFLGSVLFGIVFGFGWSPCLGTFLGSALILAGNSGTVAEGILMLLIYSAGLALPFVISSVVFENVKGLFAWFRKNSRIISIISGVLLAAVGVIFFRNGLIIALGG
jgi:cytochrome c-type biogenesis protein